MVSNQLVINYDLFISLCFDLQRFVISYLTDGEDIKKIVELYPNYENRIAESVKNCDFKNKIININDIKCIKNFKINNIILKINNDEDIGTFALFKNIMSYKILFSSNMHLEESTAKIIKLYSKFDNKLHKNIKIYNNELLPLLFHCDKFLLLSNNYQNINSHFTTKIFKYTKSSDSISDTFIFDNKSDKNQTEIFWEALFK